MKQNLCLILLAMVYFFSSRVWAVETQDSGMSVANLPSFFEEMPVEPHKNEVQILYGKLTQEELIIRDQPYAKIFRVMSAVVATDSKNQKFETLNFKDIAQGRFEFKVYNSLNINFTSFKLSFFKNNDNKAFFNKNSFDNVAINLKSLVTEEKDQTISYRIIAQTQEGITFRSPKYVLTVSTSKASQGQAFEAPSEKKPQHFFSNIFIDDIWVTAENWAHFHKVSLFSENHRAVIFFEDNAHLIINIPRTMNYRGSIGGNFFPDRNIYVFVNKQTQWFNIIINVIVSTHLLTSAAEPDNPYQPFIKPNIQAHIPNIPVVTGLFDVAINHPFLRDFHPYVFQTQNLPSVLQLGKDRVIFGRTEVGAYLHFVRPEKDEDPLSALKAYDIAVFYNSVNKTELQSHHMRIPQMTGLGIWVKGIWQIYERLKLNTKIAYAPFQFGEGTDHLQWYIDDDLEYTLTPTFSFALGFEYMWQQATIIDNYYSARPDKESPRVNYYLESIIQLNSKLIINFN